MTVKRLKSQAKDLVLKLCNTSNLKNLQPPCAATVQREVAQRPNNMLQRDADASTRN